jgi:hypothetical protein
MTAHKKRKPRARKARNEQTAKDYFLELCSAYYDDLKSTGNSAPHGQFLNNVEAVVLDQGQELLRQSFEIITQDQVDEIEKKMRRGNVRNVRGKNGIAATLQGRMKPALEL